MPNEPKPIYKVRRDMPGKNDYIPTCVWPLRVFSEFGHNEAECKQVVQKVTDDWVAELKAAGYEIQEVRGPYIKTGWAIYYETSIRVRFKSALPPNEALEAFEKMTYVSRRKKDKGTGSGVVMVSWPPPAPPAPDEGEESLGHS